VLFWCYPYYQECDGRAEKALIKWLPEMIPTPLQARWQKCIIAKEDYFEGYMA